MEIGDYQPEHAEPLRRGFETSTALCVHCCPVDPKRFQATIGGKTEKAVEERVIVAINSEGPSAFSHAVIQEPSDADGTRGAIRFLCYDPGDRASGLLVLKETVDYFKEREVSRIRAFHHHEQYPFYHRKHAYLSDRIGHVQALLLCEGFEVDSGEVHMDWEDYDPGDAYETEQPVDFTWEEEESPGPLPNLKVKARVDGEDMGECIILSCSTFDERQGDRLFVNWLGVKDAFQAKGYGRYVLQEMLREGKRRGYRHAGISTALRNHRAFAFYTNYGFCVTDWTYGWSLPETILSRSPRLR